MQTLSSPPFTVGALPNIWRDPQSTVLAVWAAITYVSVSLLTFSNALKRPLYWKWQHLNDTGVDDLKFPAGFLWGVSTAAHQVEGGSDNNQWSRWENTLRCQNLSFII